jgi:hypothetical protein
MDILYRCCAGLDVHKKTVVACVRRLDAAEQARQEIRTFGTMTGDLLALSDWLAEPAVDRWPWNRPASFGSRSSTSWRAASRFVTGPGPLPNYRTKLLICLSFLGQ